MSRFATATLGAALALAAIAGAAAQQDYPTRPIQLMVAFPAGGSTDIGARIVASIAEKELGQPIVVVNKGGAGGQVGWTELRAPAAGRLLHRLHQPAGHQHRHSRPRAQGDLHREGLHADHQPGARSGRHLGQGGQPLQDA